LLEEIGQPLQVSKQEFWSPQIQPDLPSTPPSSSTESTAEMVKGLRAAHGGALYPSRLSAQEKVAIDKELSLLTE